MSLSGSVSLTLSIEDDFDTSSKSEKKSTPSVAPQKTPEVTYDLDGTDTVSDLSGLEEVDVSLSDLIENDSSYLEYMKTHQKDEDEVDLSDSDLGSVVLLKVTATGEIVDAKHDEDNGTQIEPITTLKTEKSFLSDFDNLTSSVKSVSDISLDLGKTEDTHLKESTQIPPPADISDGTDKIFDVTTTTVATPIKTGTVLTEGLTTDFILDEIVQTATVEDPIKTSGRVTFTLEPVQIGGSRNDQQNQSPAKKSVPGGNKSKPNPPKVEPEQKPNTKPTTPPVPSSHKQNKDGDRDERKKAPPVSVDIDEMENRRKLKARKAARDHIAGYDPDSTLSKQPEPIKYKLDKKQKSPRRVTKSIENVEPAPMTQTQRRREEKIKQQLYLIKIREKQRQQEEAAIEERRLADEKRRQKESKVVRRSRPSPTHNPSQKEFAAKVKDTESIAWRARLSQFSTHVQARERAEMLKRPSYR